MQQCLEKFALIRPGFKMRISVRSSLKLIIEEIKNSCAKNTLINFDFNQLLATTNGVDRYIIARSFCKIPWNIGSLRVLAVLQELRILTATEFILNLDDNEPIQLILNDFLEAEFELLSNLFISANYDVTNTINLNVILDECLRSLFTDLLGNSNLNDLSYLKALKTQLPSDVFFKVTIKHVATVLELDKRNIKSAFINFTAWIDEGVDSLRFTRDLQKTLICEMEQEVLKYLLKISTREQFRGWKFFLILIQTIASNCKPETTSFIRKYLKARIREIALISNKQLYLHLLLTARAATATTMDKRKNIDAYADWYRQNIAEMKFVLNVDEFQNVCAVLEQCIAYEMQEYYLDIHATISISPPVLCGKLVHTYKSKCKFRLSQIKSKNTDVPEAADDSILIDSD